MFRRISGLVLCPDAKVVLFVGSRAISEVPRNWAELLVFKDNFAVSCVGFHLGTLSPRQEPHPSLSGTGERLISVMVIRTFSSRRFFFPSNPQKALKSHN